MYLRRETDCIFIMLGKCCNLQCKYCLQRAYPHKEITEKINPKIYEFIEQVREENGIIPLTLQFYGGEPLLYFNNIKEIVENTEGVRYSVITNGKLITDSMVEYFNAHNFNVAVSWDGKHVLKTRGFDAFDVRSPLRRRILRINNLTLTGVISSENYPKETLEAFQGICEEYYKLHEYFPSINIDLIFDTGIPNKYLLNVDYDRVQSEMVEMTQNYLKYVIEQKEDRKNYAKNSYIGQLYSTIKPFLDNKYEQVYSSCGNGISTLNMDLEGNLYPCHNVSAPVGTIETPYYYYLREVLKRDDTKDRQETCGHCPAVAFCKGGCKLVKDKTDYCKLKKAVFLPVLMTVSALGEELVKNGS